MRLTFILATKEANLAADDDVLAVVARQEFWRTTRWRRQAPNSHGALARNSRIKDGPVISAERKSMRCPQARANDLRRERTGNRKRALQRSRTEIDPGEIDGKQGRQRHDLKVARIGPPSA